MNTSIYGNRDFKGNIVYNPRIHPVADLTELSTLVPGGTGQQAWVEAEKRPYWWDGTAWVSYSDPSEDFYGVRTHEVEQNIPATNPAKVGTSRILSRDTLNEYPEITDNRKLAVEIYVGTGFYLEAPSYTFVRAGVSTVFLEIGSGLSIGTHYGTYQHGWVPQGIDNTLDGRVSIEDPSPLTPLFFQLDDLGNHNPESVDMHGSSYKTSGSGTFLLAFRDSGVNYPMFKWDFYIDMTDPGVGEVEKDKGLIMRVEAFDIPIGGTLSGFIYNGTTGSLFFGMPLGNARTIYF